MKGDPGKILPALHRFTTRDGLAVQVAKRGSVPLVAVRLVLEAGSSRDPDGRAGLSDFTARLLRRGTRRLDAEGVNEAVEYVGATLAAFSGEDAMTVAVTTPLEHLGPMLDVVGQLVREPTFPAPEFDIEQARTLAQLANDLDDPAQLADRGITEAVWGGHPYGHDVSGTRASVRTFTREDVIGFHAREMGPRIARLILVGPVEPAAMEDVVGGAFGGWRGGPASPSPVPETSRVARAGRVWLLDKSEQTQAQIRLAGPGFRRGSADQVTAQVTNVAIGAGFTSRLVNEIRVKRGLSYGASSAFESMRAGGSFLVSSFTKLPSTRTLIDVALAEMAKLRSRGLTAAELARAQTYLAGLFPLRVETNESVAAALAEMDLYGLGEDWLDLYRPRVRAVTRAATEQICARYAFAEPPAIVVVAPAAAVRESLVGLGPIDESASTDLA